jgi:CelD/BcsL family acetyltransferase involved in cellulose biosynthesis
MKIERIASYKKFVETKKEWNALLSCSGQNCPFLTHQWFDAWWQSFGQEGALDILFFRDKSETLVGIAPLMESNNALGFIASHEVTDYCDFFSSANKRDGFYGDLLDYLQRNISKYSHVEFINIPESSPTLSVLPRLAVKNNLIYDIHEGESVPKLTLPGSYQEYVTCLGRKNRHELRRKIRKLESLGQIRNEQIRASEKLEPAIQEFISLHKKSTLSKREFWQMREMPDFFQTLANHFSSVNWVELNMLYFENRFIAGLLNFLYGDTLYFYNIAYDREYAAYNPGFFLFNRAIEQAIANGISIADFLRGGEKYKYFFGAKESKIYSLKLEQREKNP